MKPCVHLLCPPGGPCSLARQADALVAMPSARDAAVRVAASMRMAGVEPPEDLAASLDVARDAALEGRLDAVSAILDDLDLGDLADHLELADALLAELDTALARSSLAEFVRQGWHVIEPSTALSWNWHHELICAVAQGMFEDWLRGRADPAFVQRVFNAVFSVPPGSLKSRLLAVFFPVWCWLHCPGWKVICLSVNQDASFRDGRASRDLIRSQWFQDKFQPAWRLKDDQDSISNYGNTAGGERISRAQGSEIVGLRGDALLIDDPNNPKEAENPAERDKVNDLWTTNIFNRVNDLARSLRIGVQQRVNAGDWTGYVLERDGAWDPAANPRGWLHVVLPAEFELERRCVTPWGSDPRTEPGESIHPARLTRDVLAAERARFGSEKYAGQMQQRPAPLEGGRIQRAWWGFCALAKLEGHGWAECYARPDGEAWRPRPAGTIPRANATAHQIGTAHGAGSPRPGWDLDWLVISVDPAAKKTTRGSNYGILVVGGRGGRIFVLEDATRRGEIHEVLALLRALVVKWRPDRLLIEDKAAGPDMISMLRLELLTGSASLGNVVVEPVKAVSEFGVRVDAAIPVIEQGRVFLLDGAEWLDVFVEEFGLYPAGTHDDRIDALVQVVNWARDFDVVSVLPSW